MSDPLKPTTALLMKLGSAVVHAEEALDATKRSPLDVQAFVGILSDPEVRQWFEQMNKMALLPVKR